MIPLESLASCFQGLIPAGFFTCSRDGIPNAAFLSHVEYVDATHVALSFQFFNKSKANVCENPHALVRLIDPDTSQGWRLRLRYVRSETSGPVFERMDLRIEAIASYTGLKGIFKLRAADIYEVLSVEAVEDEPGRVVPEAVRARSVDPVFTMRAMQDFAERIHRADGLDSLLDSILEGLEASFGFTHAMILVPAAEDGTLVTIASRGYLEAGTGAEVRYGEGICGVVAEARKPIRISALIRQTLSSFALYKRSTEQGLCLHADIALPALPTAASQLGVPLLNRGELIGVLCIESEQSYRFHEEDKTAVELLGSYLAIAIHATALRERADAPPDPAPAAVAAPPVRDNAARPAGKAAVREVAYYAADECILVDGEYLIRSLPARILWKLLNARQAEGRIEFTNRELRLDKSLNLPEWKDNLESRLLLLRRRLEQKCPDLRILPKARGRFVLELASDVSLVPKP
jgi:putative methionine-R-sulfoxide reductase with GAF domain